MATPTIKYGFKIDKILDNDAYFYTDLNFLNTTKLRQYGTIDEPVAISNRYHIIFNPCFDKNEIIAYMRKLETESGVK